MNRGLAILTWSFAVLLGFSSLWNGFLVLQQYRMEKDLQSLGSRTARAHQLQAVVQGFVNDLIIYGQHHPAIHPLLQKHGIAFPEGQKTPPPPASRS